VIQVISESQSEVVLKENGRSRFTIDLQAALKSPVKTEAEVKERTGRQDKPVRLDALEMVWKEFAEMRKTQVAEYHLLNREFVFQNNLITLPLSNSIEELLLANIKIHLTTHLRDKLENSAITVIGTLQEITSKKPIYTNKEKFDHLAEKNPSLIELKNRLGLDTDY